VWFDMYILFIGFPNNVFVFIGNVFVFIIIST
jgi:hypothetical protein